MSAGSDERPGRPSGSRNVESIAQVLVRNDRRLTVLGTAEEAGISCGSCDRYILTDLGMGRVFP